jgi:hypothetical protein
MNKLTLLIEHLEKITNKRVKLTEGGFKLKEVEALMSLKVPETLKDILPENIREWMLFKAQCERLLRPSREVVRWIEENNISFNPGSPEETMKEYILQGKPYKHSLVELLDNARNLTGNSLTFVKKLFYTAADIDLAYILSSYVDLLNADDVVEFLYHDDEEDEEIDYEISLDDKYRHVNKNRLWKLPLYGMPIIIPAKITHIQNVSFSKRNVGTQEVKTNGPLFIRNLTLDNFSKLVITGNKLEVGYLMLQRELESNKDVLKNLELPSNTILNTLHIEVNSFSSLKKGIEIPNNPVINKVIVTSNNSSEILREIVINNQVYKTIQVHNNSNEAEYIRVT